MKQDHHAWLIYITNVSEFRHLYHTELTVLYSNRKVLCRYISSSFLFPLSRLYFLSAFYRVLKGCTVLGSFLCTLRNLEAQ